MEEFWEEIEGMRRTLTDLSSRMTAAEGENAELRERVSSLEARLEQKGATTAVPHAAVAAQQTGAAAPPA